MHLLLQPVPLFVVILVIIFFITVAFFYFRHLKSILQHHSLEIEKSDRELKRKVLELQVLHSLEERAGYSLDIQQILEVIVDSLKDLIGYSTASYMILGSEGQILSKVYLQEAVSHQFLSQARTQMLSALEHLTKQTFQAELVSETLAGVNIDDNNKALVGSFFNLPLVVGGQVVALINASSTKKALYGGEEIAFLQIILDQISAQANKLAQVIENEKKRLSAMIRSLTDGIAMVDAKFNLIVINPSLNKLLNLTAATNVYGLIASIGSKTNLEGALQEAWQTQTVVKLPEFALNEKIITIEIEPVKDYSNSLLGLTIVFHDITTQKQLEKLREEFTAMMVHELRTPLTTITYSADMMINDLSKLTPQALTQNLTVIKSTSQNMLELVGELLDVAKIEAGKFVVVKKEGDLVQALDEKSLAFKPVVDQKHIQLVTEIDSRLTKVNFDKVRLGQVINNLLSNAAKYTDHGQISLKAALQNGGVEIAVSDSGEGIKPEDLSKLFSKFEQVGKGKTGEKGGTGLGLVVSKGIIEAHGGKIWVTSKGEGQGTTFTFTIPIN